MPTAAQQLARFAAELQYDDIPAAALQRARDCILDTVAAAIFGSTLPWSRIVTGYARRYGSGGEASILGAGGARVAAPMAALANGAQAHAFELDSLRQPSGGVHPGATLTPPGLAIAEETGASGKSLLAAFVAGCEVMFRIGDASRHSSEKLGFHAPGLTGPYGGAVVAGRLLGLNPAQMANALGIAGSLSSGLLAFTKSSGGGMVKRLHLGRASEAGVLAARLAGDGYEGPETVLEGRFGFLEAFCRDAEPGRLTRRLGEDWETQKIALKRYSCHITAHTPVQSIRELMSEHRFGGDDVEEISVAGSEKLASHHAIHEPNDIMQGQYSVAWCTALALYRDPEDPRVFSEQNLNDPAIRALTRKVKVEAAEPQFDSGWASRISVGLKNGNRYSREAHDFKGAPSNPLSREELGRKFLKLTAGLGAAESQRLLDRLEQLEREDNVARLDFTGKS